jgi:2-polyprenyl-6-methoxyphenol hydroxylase-like FAD-dependent oxidoreductase
MAGRQREHAIVIGAGLAGLAAATALAGRVGHVTLVERDPLPEGAEPRRGVPQAPHQHICLARGRAALEALFPGLEAELVAAGVEPMDVGEELAWLTPAGWTPRFRSGIAILPCSRALLESLVRRRVRATGGVEVRDGQEVTGLVVRGGRVAGVGLRPTGERAGAGAELAADLVVDASGRGSRLPAWLEEAALPAPEEVVVDAHVVYASRAFRGTPALPPGIRGAFLQGAPPAVTRGGALLPLEGGRALVTLIGRGEEPPGDGAAFLAYAATLRSPMIHDAIAGLEPVSDIAVSRSTRNRRRRYERLRPWPPGLVVLGDAACAFNPVYGQGMTAAVLGAIALGRGLDRAGTIGLQRRLARIAAAPWALDTAIDLRVRGAIGPPPGRRVRARQAYLARVARLGTERRDVRLAWLRVTHMLRSPAALLRPDILARAAAAAARERRAGRRARAPARTSRP